MISECITTAPHLVAGVNVEPHVVIVEPSVLLGLALGDGDLVERRNVAGREERKGRIVEEVL